jgi:hypothetical protein
VRGYTILIAVPCTTSGTATEPPPPPPPPPPPVADCATPQDVVAARDAIIAALPSASNAPVLAAIAGAQNTILNTMAADKSAILAAASADKSAVLAALSATKAEILAAISAIQIPAPSPSTGYVKIGAVQYDSLAVAAAEAGAGALVEIYGELRDLDASAAFLNSCDIVGMTPDAKLNWTLGTSQRMAFGKGHIVCAGAGQTYVVENLELTGARVTSLNGAGVRGDNAALITVRNCNIHDNEAGVLSIATAQRYFGNTFKDNGNSGSHHIYANLASVDDVLIEGNTFYTAKVGNQIKSRAKKTVIRQNTIAELDGSCSWQIDISNGGDVLIEKNVIEQGPSASNRNMISYGPEGVPVDGRVNALVVSGNVLINDNPQVAWGVNIFNQPTAAPQITGNTFVGPFDQYVVNGALDATNVTFASRADAGFAAYPALPGVPA